MSKVQLQGNVSGTGIFTIASPNSNVDRTINLPDATGTVQVSGNPISGTTGTFSGLIFANGGGVQFPATQVSSSDPNCLDDYEEGNWTPAWNTNNGNMTVSYSVQAGRYTKIGRMVYLTGYLKPASISSQGTGQIVITGLPFPVVEEIGLNVVDGNGLRNYMSSTQTMITGYGQNTNQLRPGTMGSGGNSYGLTTGSLTTDFFLFSAYYPSS